MNGWLAFALQAAAKAVLAMQQKPPDPPGATPSTAPAPGQDREAALALSGEEAFARRAMYANSSTDCAASIYLELACALDTGLSSTSGAFVF